MKEAIQSLVIQALETLHREGVLAELPAPADIEVTRTRDATHGDYATNIALKLAKQVQRPPHQLAGLLLARLPVSTAVVKTEIAGPGFINFFVSSAATLATVHTILAEGERFGRSRHGQEKRVQVEFVSANPTGPLHVGHGRGAAYGASVADLLEAIGFAVEREYYVNDAGRQMNILAASVWLRYLELAGEQLPFATNAYKGDYVWDIAATLHREHGDAFRRPAAEVLAHLPPDEPAGGDKEIYIDAVIERAQALLGAAAYRQVFDLGLNAILDDIRRDLAGFGVTFQRWYSERTLTECGTVQRVIERLRAAGHVYVQDGALWFRSTAFGDEKDRVVLRENGQTTYFASDIAYHIDKFERGFERVINVWGADHHGYVPRVKAALQALGFNPAQLDVMLVQFAILYQGGERMQMSTRSGEFVTLRELREEVGNDAARFFYVMRRADQHLDFDLDLAKTHSNDNPVFYIQYAHARVCSVLREASEQGLASDSTDANLDRLTESHETDLIGKLATYPETLQQAALALEPHQLANYLRELAMLFHTYYNAHRFLVDDATLRDARLALARATRQVLANGLRLLSVTPLERM
ncbi:MAG: arginine--tRNA ligase [Thiotrichales bacterium]